jgi:hypothetical protein
MMILILGDYPRKMTQTGLSLVWCTTGDHPTALDWRLLPGREGPMASLSQPMRASMRNGPSGLCSSRLLIPVSFLLGLMLRSPFESHTLLSVNIPSRARALAQTFEEQDASSPAAGEVPIGHVARMGADGATITVR